MEFRAFILVLALFGALGVYFAELDQSNHIEVEPTK